MATITFSPHPRGEAITLDVGGDIGRTLLEVARKHNIPILFNCAAGACGACLVEVAWRPGGDALAPPHSAEEILFLQAIGRLIAAGGAADKAVRPFGQLRLACQTIVPDADIRVRYPNAFGGM